MGNIQKTIRYFKRNGFKRTYYAAKERLFLKDVPLSVDNFEFNGPIDENIKFSVLVPVYETNEIHLREMIDSVLSQVYSNFELIIADASKTDGPENIISSYEDTRIRYLKLESNKGISENTNEAIREALGDYCCLLDHDDLITPDALYENALRISAYKKAGKEINLLYSDEDKCDAKAEKHFEKHVKDDFNLDLLLSNNYICHFSVVETSLLKRLLLRGEYDGAQDYDLFLRIALNCEPETIVHIGKVLYHWRCHEASTSANPESKEYAYLSGKRAIEDFVLNKYGVKVPVKELPHKGFYSVCWGEDIFKIRKDIGGYGSVYIKGKRIRNGVMSKNGEALFFGLNKWYSGYMHKAVLTMDIEACDFRTIVSAPLLKNEYETLKKEYDSVLSSSKLSDEKIDSLSFEYGIRFCRLAKEKGLLFLYKRDIR